MQTVPRLANGNAVHVLAVLQRARLYDKLPLRSAFVHKHCDATAADCRRENLQLKNNTISVSITTVTESTVTREK
jgi:hypothetical protein